MVCVCVCACARALVVKLQTEASELRRNLQQAADGRLQAEREKQDAQNEVQTHGNGASASVF